MKYVEVYDYDDDYIWYGYYPGYVGIYVHNGVIIYGTGYWYHGWCGRYYYGRPVTFGYGIHYYSWHSHCHGGVTYHSYYKNKRVHGSHGYHHKETFSREFYDGDYYRQAWSKQNTKIERERATLESRRKQYAYNYDGDRALQSKRNTTITGKDRSLSTTKTRDIRVDRDGNISAEMNRKRDIDGKKYNVDSETNRKLNINDGDKSLTVDKEITISDKYGNSKTYEYSKDFDGSRRENNLYSDKKGNVYKRDFEGWKQNSGEKWKKVQQPTQQRSLNRQYKSRSKSMRRSFSRGRR